MLLLLLLLGVADVVCGMGIGSMQLHIGGVIVSFIFDFITNEEGLVVVHGLCVCVVNWQACVCVCVSVVCIKLK